MPDLTLSGTPALLLLLLLLLLLYSFCGVRQHPSTYGTTITTATTCEIQIPSPALHSASLLSPISSLPSHLSPTSALLPPLGTCPPLPRDENKRAEKGKGGNTKKERPSPVRAPPSATSTSHLSHTGTASRLGLGPHTKNGRWPGHLSPLILPSRDRVSAFVFGCFLFFFFFGNIIFRTKSEKRRVPMRWRNHALHAGQLYAHANSHAPPWGRAPLAYVSRTRET